GLRIPRPARHDVGAVMHPVNEEDVERPSIPVHRLDPRRSPPLPGMRRRVRLADVGLRLDDPAAVPPPAPPPREPGSDQAPRDLDRLPPEERARRRTKAEPRRIEPQTRVGCRYHADREL